MLNGILFDVRYACRLWLSAPRYFLVCTAVVALSVGLSLWACVLVYTMALKPLPLPGANRWWNIQMAATATASSEPTMDPFTYQELLKRSPKITHLGAYSPRQVVLRDNHASTRLRAAAITPQLLSATKVVPQLGRLFDADEGRRDTATTAIISYSTWQAYFAGDPSVVGRTAQIDGRTVQVVGVLPADFFAFDDFEVWYPLHLAPQAAPDPAADSIVAMVIFDDEQEKEKAAIALQPVVDDINKTYPNLFDPHRHVVMVPAHLMFTHGFLQVAVMISLVAVAVLLLGSVNIGLVFFARLLERSRELALRMALGSSRWRVLRQCLIESAMVMIAGLALGVLLTVYGVRWTRGISDFLTQYLDNGRDGNPLTVQSFDLVLAVTITAVIWLVSTLVPSWRIAKQDVVQNLSGTGKGVGSSARGRSVGVIVGFQVLVASIVLGVCMNLLVAVREESSKPTGIAMERVMVSTYPTTLDAHYAAASERDRYWSDLSGAIREKVPGADVAFMTEIPTRAPSKPIAIEGQERSAAEGLLKIPVTSVSANYFDLLGISLRSGRLFDSSDNATAVNTAVLDEVTARRYWPNQVPVGKRIQLNPGEKGPWVTIVGIVSAVGYEPYGDTGGVIYRPLRQANAPSFLLMAKLPGANAQRRALQDAAFAVDMDMPLHNLQFLKDYLTAVDLTYSALIPVFGIISGITMILAASGLFGLISRFVVRRTQEIGIRRALGSSPRRIHWLFLRQSAIYMAVGTIGGALSLLIIGAIAASIPNILSHAVVVTLGVLLLIAVVIFLATYLPTQRALALEPSDALRYE